MDTYKISHPYLGVLLSDGSLEIEITSENLIYSEVCSTHYGLQCINNNNKKQIAEKCKQVSELIKEIDKLNTI